MVASIFSALAIEESMVSRESARRLGRALGGIYEADEDGRLLLDMLTRLARGEMGPEAADAVWLLADEEYQLRQEDTRYPGILARLHKLMMEAFNAGRPSS